MMAASFKKTQALGEFQRTISDIYGLPDDRLFSIWDLLTQQQRFTMRALKGVRKNENEKIKTNLLIALSWLMAISTRLHIDAETEVWKRFPYICSYCGNQPCLCKSQKSLKRVKVKVDNSKRPMNLNDMQLMFDEIYPSSKRTISDAGIHLAEEMGEVSEAIHNYLGQHKAKLFNHMKLEMADYVSCVFGLANSAKINVADELANLYYDNCHVCHHAPCECSFSAVAEFS